MKEYEVGTKAGPLEVMVSGTKRLSVSQAVKIVLEDVIIQSTYITQRPQFWNRR